MNKLLKNIVLYSTACLIGSFFLSKIAIVDSLESTSTTNEDDSTINSIDNNETETDEETKYFDAGEHVLTLIFRPHIYVEPKMRDLLLVNIMKYQMVIQF